MHEGWLIAWVLAVIFLATLIQSAFGLVGRSYGSLKTWTAERAMMPPIFWYDIALFFFILVLVVGVFPGAIAGTAIVWAKGRPRAGLWRGAVGGLVGGLFGLLIFLGYENSLPTRLAVGPFGYYREIIDPPPRYVMPLSIFVGSLIWVVVLGAFIARRPRSPK
jgi:hypothetical protein